MEIEVTKKKVMLALLAVAVLIVLSFVYAGSFTSPRTGIGHDIDELQRCGANEILKVNAAGNAWTCATDLQGSGGGASGVVYKRAFVTTGTWTGNLGGLGGADAKCQQEANVAGLGGAWKALLSAGADYMGGPYNGSYINARDRIGYNWDVLVNMRGGILATNPRAALQAGTDAGQGEFDLWDYNKLNPFLPGTDPNYHTRGAIKYHADGSPVSYPNIDVWTGTRNDGTVDDGNECFWWSMDSDRPGIKGIPTAYIDRGSQWLTYSSGSSRCDAPARLYCIEQ